MSHTRHCHTRTQLCHAQLPHTHSFVAGHFVTRNPRHTRAQIFHTRLCHTHLCHTRLCHAKLLKRLTLHHPLCPFFFLRAASTTFSNSWKKLTCGVCGPLIPCRHPSSKAGLRTSSPRLPLLLAAVMRGGAVDSGRPYVQVNRLDAWLAQENVFLVNCISREFIGSSRRPFGAHVEGHAVPGRGEATPTQGWPQSPRPFLQAVGQPNKVSCRPFAGRHEHISGGSPEPATAPGAWPGHCQRTRRRNLDATIGSAVVFSPGPNSKI